jgi:hypothetical protein
MDFLNGPIEQNIYERIRYWFYAGAWGEGPTNVSVTVLQDAVDVTAAVTSGGTQLSGDTVTLPFIENLDANTTYVLRVEWDTAAGDTLVASTEIVGVA